MIAKICDGKEIAAIAINFNDMHAKVKLELSKYSKHVQMTMKKILVLNFIIPPIRMALK